MRRDSKCVCYLTCMHNLMLEKSRKWREVKARFNLVSHNTGKIFSPPLWTRENDFYLLVETCCFFFKKLIFSFTVSLKRPKLMTTRPCSYWINVFLVYSHVFTVTRNSTRKWCFRLRKNRRQTHFPLDSAFLSPFSPFVF